jgi:Ca2+-binding RTX toxin-like protein
VKDLVTGDIVLASTSNGNAVKGNGNSLNSSLSGEGTIVAFNSSATNLTLTDVDPLSDIYVKNLVGGDIALASTSTGNVKANAESTLPSLSADGDTVAFASEATNLNPLDTDAFLDIFVKDLGGPVTFPRPCHLPGAIVGTHGPDELAGTPEDDIICGLEGDDILRGGGGNDLILGARGNDVINGGSGADRLRGDDGNDFIRGLGGPDEIDGGSGADMVEGNLDDDHLKGGPGPDRVNGGSGNDLCFAGTDPGDTEVHCEG